MQTSRTRQIRTVDFAPKRNDDVAFPGDTQMKNVVKNTTYSVNLAMEEKSESSNSSDSETMMMAMATDNIQNDTNDNCVVCRCFHQSEILSYGHINPTLVINVNAVGML